ncbi:hypothetical protein HOG17_00810 [Candidatus Peregrinibacteria bacterium]|nr:hypothetical protein [Candidatus Peregrinibacteria bacterium]MBT4148607.1 hypothetical protein [Candidatus Peregrinibacteria bacterium]MBT4455776.1 hypothetical protein [Candidatus Peregrinibacteria bacterium]
MKLKFKWTIRLLVTAFATYFMLYSGYVMLASGDSYKFESPKLGFGLVKYTYHIEMSMYFNEKIEKMLAMKLDDPNQLPPTGEECPPNNISTYCVAMGALDRYMAYLDTLDRVKALFGPFDLETEPTLMKYLTLGLTGLGETSISQVLGLSSLLNDAVAREKDSAYAVMDATIAAYNELRVAYPMHKKYEETIDLLYKYRNAVRWVRRDAMRLPTKYVDATSKKGCE